MNRPPSAQQNLQRLPKKWAVVIVVALILYALVQPFANSRWGWNLTSLGGASSAEKPVAKPVAKNSTNTNVLAKSDTQVAEKKVAEKKTSGNAERDSERSATDADQNDSDTAALDHPLAPTLPSNSILKKAGSNAGTSSTAGTNSTANKSTGSKAEPPKSSTQPTVPPKTDSSKTSPPKSTSSEGTNAADSNLLYGLLKDAGREVYISPAGLRYTRGSEEGHRLMHLEKHLKDIPDRPGKHGVFDGDMAQVLRWIDDAFTRGKQGAKGVRKRDEDSRTVYEVPFTKRIGYVGGRDGKRDNNPDAKRLRLVVDGDQVITAFPF